MSRIELGGVLGKTFGKVHHRLISRVSEAGVALAKTIPGFEQFMISSQRRGLTYSVFKGKKNIGEDDLGFPVTGDVIRIVPVVIGSKKAGVLQTILGAVLVVVGVAIGYFSGGTLSAAGYAAAKFGAAMMIGGVVQMLSLNQRVWPANKALITAHPTRLAGLQTPLRRAIRYHSFMVVGESAARLFLPGYMSKISNK